MRPSPGLLERHRGHESGRWRGHRDKSSGDRGCLHGDAVVTWQTGGSIDVQPQQGQPNGNSMNRRHTWRLNQS